MLSIHEKAVFEGEAYDSTAEKKRFSAEANHKREKITLPTDLRDNICPGPIWLESQPILRTVKRPGQKGSKVEIM